MANYNIERITAGCEKIGVSLTEEQLNQFIKYYELLVEWNSFMNLTAITDFDEVCKKHFLDSLSIVKAYDVETLTSGNISIIDI